MAGSKATRSTTMHEASSTYVATINQPPLTPSQGITNPGATISLQRDLIQALMIVRSFRVPQIKPHSPPLVLQRKNYMASKCYKQTSIWKVQMNCWTLCTTSFDNKIHPHSKESNALNWASTTLLLKKTLCKRLCLYCRPGVDQGKGRRSS